MVRAQKAEILQSINNGLEYFLYKHKNYYTYTKILKVFFLIDDIELSYIV